MWDPETEIEGKTAHQPARISLPATDYSDALPERQENVGTVAKYVTIIAGVISSFR
jgi:hypothetical protein